jgi:hypothetical protein
MKHFSKTHYPFGIALLLWPILFSGCMSNSVDYKLDDHAYYKYARKLMGKDGTKEMKDGRHFEYHPNGRTRFEYSVRKGKLNGVATTWDEDGLMTSRLVYENDVVTKDLLADEKEKGDGIYRVQVSAERPGVEPINLKQDPEKAAKAVQDITQDITTNSVKQTDITSKGAVQQINSRKSPAVKKINGYKPVF